MAVPLTDPSAAASLGDRDELAAGPVGRVPYFGQDETVLLQLCLHLGTLSEPQSRIRGQDRAIGVTLPLPH